MMLLITSLLLLCWPSLQSEALICNGRADNCDKKITEIIIPGAHNAGAYNLQYHSRGRYLRSYGDQENNVKVVGLHVCHRWRDYIVWLLKAVPHIGLLASMSGHALKDRLTSVSQNHDRSITEMLQNGIRYFDLDTCVDPATGALHTCHCMYGKKMNLILDEVRGFLDRHPHEVVVLDFGNGLKEHECGHSRAYELAYYVKFGIGHHLAPKSYLSKPLRELIRLRKRVFVIWRHKKTDTAWGVSSWGVGEGNVTGMYSKTEDPQFLFDDQKSKLRNDPNNFHVVNWFLTFSSPKANIFLEDARCKQAETHKALVEKFFPLLKGKGAVVSLDYYRKLYPNLPQLVRDLQTPTGSHTCSLKVATARDK